MARKNKKQRKHPKFWFGFKIVLLLFLLTILVGGIVFYFKYGKDIFAKPLHGVPMYATSQPSHTPLSACAPISLDFLKSPAQYPAGIEVHPVHKRKYPLHPVNFLPNTGSSR